MVTRSELKAASATVLEESGDLQTLGAARIRCLAAEMVASIAFAVAPTFSPDPLEIPFERREIHTEQVNKQNCRHVILRRKETRHLWSTISTK